MKVRDGLGGTWKVRRRWLPRRRVRVPEWAGSIAKGAGLAQGADTSIIGLIFLVIAGICLIPVVIFLIVIGFELLLLLLLLPLLLLIKVARNGAWELSVRSPDKKKARLDVHGWRASSDVLHRIANALPSYRGGPIFWDRFLPAEELQPASRLMRG